MTEEQGKEMHRDIAEKQAWDPRPRFDSPFGHLLSPWFIVLMVVIAIGFVIIWVLNDEHNSSWVYIPLGLWLLAAAGRVLYLWIAWRPSNRWAGKGKPQ